MKTSLLLFALVSLVFNASPARAADTPAAADAAFRAALLMQIDAADELQLQQMIDDQSAALERDHPELREFAVELRAEARRPGLKERLKHWLKHAGKGLELVAGYGALGASYLVMVPAVGVYNIVVAAASGKTGNPDNAMNTDVEQKYTFYGIGTMSLTELSSYVSYWAFSPALFGAAVLGTVSSMVLRSHCYANPHQMSRFCWRMLKLERGVLLPAAHAEGKIGLWFRRVFHAIFHRRHTARPQIAEPLVLP